MLSAYGLHNVHVLLLSKIGEPYDPKTQKGVVGRNYTYQTESSVNVFTREKNLNPFMGAGALGQIVDDYNGNNSDHEPHGFIGGGYIAMWQTDGRPIGQMALPEDTPSWGAGWKWVAAENYLRAARIQIHASSMSHRDAYLDLDDTYHDVYGNPLLRMTFDFPDNDLKMSRFITDKTVEIAKAMRPRGYKVNYREGPYSIVPYQTIHNTGGVQADRGPDLHEDIDIVQIKTVL